MSDKLCIFRDGDASVDITIESLQKTLETISGHLSRGEGFSLATVNLDHLVKLRKDAKFRAAYAGQTHIVADGRPIVWLSRMAGRPVHLTPGSELIDPICAQAARSGTPVALYGASPETIDGASSRLKALHPGLNVVFTEAPPYGVDPDGHEVAAALERVRDSGARLCFLALGAPKQEIISVRGVDFAPGCGFISIGAGLDFISGAQKRAPVWMRRLAVEWIWRLSTDPRRLGPRYAACALLMPALAVNALRGNALISVS